MDSERLRYAPLTDADIDAFHRLAVDAHVRRYLLDGDVVSREWCAERIAESRASFERRGIGLVLVHERNGGALVGFCGFLELPSVHPGPQLVYALLERFTGCGYATEMARACIVHACTHAGMRDVVASVDAVNVASRRVLEKLGFEPVGTQEGQFGDVVLLRLSAA